MVSQTVYYYLDCGSAIIIIILQLQWLFLFFDSIQNRSIISFEKSAITFEVIYKISFTTIAQLANTTISFKMLNFNFDISPGRLHWKDYTVSFAKK